MIEKDQLIYQYQEIDGSTSLMLIERVAPDFEDAHIHVCQLMRDVKGRTFAINHVRFYGKEFQRIMIRQNGWNRTGVENIIDRYFLSLEKARREIQIG